MKGILFKTDSHKAIREGRKTQTRRLLSRTSESFDCDLMPGHDKDSIVWLFRHKELSEVIAAKPRYQVGDVVYIKEALYRNPYFDEAGYLLDQSAVMVNGVIGDMLKWRWQRDVLSGMFMPQEAARDFIKMADVRPQRLQEITEEDCIAEGVNGYLVSKFSYGKDYRVFRPYHKEAYPLIDHADVGDIVRFQGPNMGFASFITRNPKATGNLSINAKEAFDYIGSIEPDYILGYGILWDSINPKYPWATNPWVWRYEFKPTLQ